MNFHKLRIYFLRTCHSSGLNIKYIIVFRYEFFKKSFIQLKPLGDYALRKLILQQYSKFLNFYIHIKIKKGHFYLKNSNKRTKGKTENTPKSDKRAYTLISTSKSSLRKARLYLILLISVVTLKFLLSLIISTKRVCFSAKGGRGIRKYLSILNTKFQL